MITIFEDSDSQPVTVGLNNKFFSVYEKLPDSSMNFINEVCNHGSSLKLLDGKYGNFCYCPGKFLAVSLAHSSTVESYLGRKASSLRKIWIQLFEGTGNRRISDVFKFVLVNVDHARDSYEKSSSMFARSVVKKLSLCESFYEARDYLKNMEKSRYEKFILF